MVFQCTKCKYKTTRKSHYNRHINGVHNKIKNFECELCNSKFSTNGHLQRHIKAIHLIPKNFECKLCNFKFSRNRELIQHYKQIHLKLKNFECSKCPYKCSANGNLQTHFKQVHTKIRDFKCKLCPYKCSRNNDLQRHIKNCTGKDNCSAGEYKIKQILNEMRVKYKFDSSYEVKSHKRGLRWDFIIESDEPIFIEFDGKQHFEPRCFGGISMEKAQLAFEIQQTYDKIKNDYCNNNGYLFLRIAYTEYENIESIVVKFIRDNTDWGYE